MNSSISGSTSSDEHADPAPAPAGPAQPSAHRRAFITWLAVYPTITVVLAALGPYTGGLPVWVRTLILTAVVVPIVAYGLIPWLLKANARLSARSGRR
ncbi:hypothetical protein [Streptomyces sp. NPDC089919]|uniref:hypothetical protein n=1 Tax=Streptomyces sp. NPDC089919 TaxID=3155188 RepID=UPI00344859EF